MVSDIIDKRLKAFRLELLEEVRKYERMSREDMFVSPEQVQKRAEEKRKLKEAIEEAYKDYPRKQGKGEGIKWLLRGKRFSMDDLEDFKRAIYLYGASVEGREKHYIKQFSTWVKNWRDSLELKETQTKTFKF